MRATLRGILAAHGQPIRPAAALTSIEIKKLLNVWSRPPCTSPAVG